MARKITTGKVLSNGLKGQKERFFYKICYIDKSGNRRKKNSPYAKSKDEAKNLCDVMVREVITPLTMVEDTTITLRTLFQDKIEIMKEAVKLSAQGRLGKKISSSNVYDFDKKLTIYVFSQEKKYKFLDEPISTLTVDDISRIKTDINNCRLSERYTKNLFSHLNNLLLFAKERGHINNSFYVDCMRVSAIGKKSEPKKDLDLFFTFEEFKLILEYVDKHYKREIDKQFFRTFYVVQFFQCNRMGETIALLWKDFDFEKNTMSIYKSYNDTKIYEPFNIEQGYLKKYNGEHFELNRTKTVDGERDFFLHDFAKKELQRLKDIYQEQGIYNENDFVFLYGMRPLSTRTANNNFKKMLERIHNEHNEFSIERTIHSLRHSGCSYYKEIGIELKELIKILGHRNSEMINKVYSHDYAPKESTYEILRRANDKYQL